MFAAATIAVGMRLYTRVKFLRGLKAEDWLISAAWVWMAVPPRRLAVFIHAQAR